MSALRVAGMNCLCLFGIAVLNTTTPLPAQNLPGSSISMKLSAFETGLTLPQPQSFVNATVPCRFDDWKKTASWGDGSPTETLTHSVTASLPGPSTPDGSYPLYSNHSYSSAGSYTVTLQLFVHCYGSTGGTGLAAQNTYTVAVYDRLPLRAFILSSNKVKRGQGIRLSAETFADAPVSNTRVYFCSNKPRVFSESAKASMPTAQCDISSPSLLTYADIAHQSKMVTTTINVSPHAPLGTVTLTAAAGSAISKTLTVVP